jgi:signal transduction histidine kinase
LLLGAVLAAAGLLPLGHMLALAYIRPHTMMLKFSHGDLMLAVTAVILLAVGAWHVHRGLSPFDELRARLASVRAGRERRIEGTYPAEVQPLVTELNALLNDREQLVTRAQAKAGDLAHALKTPLAILAQEAEGALAAGHTELASTMDQQVQRMRRHVDYQLAHARAAASGGSLGPRCSVAASVEGLVRALLRLHAGRGLRIEAEVGPELTTKAQREDLDEMLGNLLDNACKWARTRVKIRAAEGNLGLIVTVDDDGPGLAPAMRDAVLQRGVRADEAAPGSGLGLAIVRDLAELYGGRVALEQAPEGGVRARLELP